MSAPQIKNAKSTGPKGPVAVCNTVLDGIASLFKILATLCLAVMVILNLYNIISRSFFNVAYGWIFNWTMLLFVWMLLLGLFVYIRDRRDVSVDLFMVRLPAPLRKIAGLFVCVVGVVTMLAILRGAPELLKLQSKPMEAIDLPMYVRSGPLFISAILVAIHFVLEFISIAAGWTPAFARAEEDGDATEKGAPE